MVTKADVDFGRQAAAYARHRAGFPESFFRRLDALELFRPGEAVLDAGTGTGTVARGLARCGLRVTGLDPSADLIAEARRLDRSAGIEIDYMVGRIEDTGLAAHIFDAIAAGQCWHWFDHDRATAEVCRLLKPGGLLMVAYLDWIDEPGNPVHLMYDLQRKYNPDWGSDWPLGFYPQTPDDLSFAGLEPHDTFFYREGIDYTHAAWRGRMRAYAGIGGSLPAPLVEQFDREFAAALAARFPHEPMCIPHKIWAVIWRLPG